MDRDWHLVVEALSFKGIVLQYMHNENFVSGPYILLNIHTVQKDTKRNMTVNISSNY